MGCVEDKQMLADSINETLAPFRERRRELEDKPDYLEQILGDGAAKARIIAQETLSEVFDRMNMSAR